MNEVVKETVLPQGDKQVNKAQAPKGGDQGGHRDQAAVEASPAPKQEGN